MWILEVVEMPREIFVLKGRLQGNEETHFHRNASWRSDGERRKMMSWMRMERVPEREDDSKVPIS